MSDDSDDFNAPVTDGSGTTVNVPYTPPPDPPAPDVAPDTPPDPGCVTTTVEIFPDPDVPVCVPPGTDVPDKPEDTGPEEEDSGDSSSDSE